tara:strand:- start:34 stop:378 length:345 start_codon:yes stop_codon:yes gene_type:complete
MQSLCQTNQKIKKEEEEMTAQGELFINEDLAYAFKKELDKAFGKGKYTVDGSDYGDIWNLSNFPKIVTVPVRDPNTEKKIGTVTFTQKLEIMDEGNGRYVEPIPDKIKIKKRKH